jgi:hypothetical protein
MCEHFPLWPQVPVFVGAPLCAKVPQTLKETCSDQAHLWATVTQAVCRTRDRVHLQRCGLQSHLCRNVPPLPLEARGLRQVSQRWFLPGLPPWLVAHILLACGFSSAPVGCVLISSFLKRLKNLAFLATHVNMLAYSCDVLGNV